MEIIDLSRELFHRTQTHCPPPPPSQCPFNRPDGAAEILYVRHLS
jgi:hypothetical protein